MTVEENDRTFGLGTRVKVISGAWEGCEGVVMKIRNPEIGKFLLQIKTDAFFGGETLHFWSHKLDKIDN